MCRAGGRRCPGGGGAHQRSTEEDREAARYAARERELDAAASRGEDITEKLAAEKLQRDNALAAEIAARLGG